jgi:hypothetical protein
MAWADYLLFFDGSPMVESTQENTILTVYSRTSEVVVANSAVETVNDHPEGEEKALPIRFRGG